MASFGRVLDVVHRATLGLHMTEIQLLTLNLNLSAFWLMLEVGRRPDLGFHVLDVRQGLVEDFELPMG